MRSLGKVFVAGLVFALFAAAGAATAVEKDPVTGGLLVLPDGESATAGTAATPEPPSAAPAPKPVLKPAPETVPAAVPTGASPGPGTGDDTSWGLLVRGGYFGVPNAIADELFYEHPEVSGQTFGAEIRYHGEGGGRGVESIGLAIETAKAKADGTWRQTESDSPEEVTGEISILAITLTGYWSLFPSWYVHPYIGVGIGVAHVKGNYQDADERVDADIWIPAVHIPVGLAIELGKRLQLAIEGRFIDGIAIGGALQVRL